MTTDHMLAKGAEGLAQGGDRDAHQGFASQAFLPLRLMRSCVPGLLLLLGCLSLTPAQAGNDLSYQKLYARWGAGVNPAGYGTGMTVALGEKWAVLGMPAASQGAAGLGAVQVFSAATGVWKRLILPPAPVADMAFGSAVAVWGDLALIGAPGVDGGKGAAFVYNLNTGVRMHTLSVPEGVAGDHFGAAVALAGRHVIVGAPDWNDSRGSAYHFNLATGLRAHVLQLGGEASAGGKLGVAIACDGSVALLGAPGAFGNKGAAYAFDLEDQFEYTNYLRAFFHPSPVAGDRVGTTVAMSGGRVLLGAPGRNSDGGSVLVLRQSRDPILAPFVAEVSTFAGPAEGFGACLSADQDKILVSPGAGAATNGTVGLYDLSTCQQVRTLRSPEAALSFFGLSHAMCRNRALFSAPGDSTRALNEGAAFLAQPLIVPVSKLTKYTSGKEYAPGVPDATFNVLGDAYVSTDNVSFLSTLAGYGSGGGKDQGSWEVQLFGPVPDLQLALKTRNVLADGAVVAAINASLYNSPVHQLLLTTLKTGVAGITAANSKRLLHRAGNLLTTRLATGTAVPALGNARLAAFGELAQGTTDYVDNWGTAFTLIREPASIAATRPLATTAANDSGILAASEGNISVAREGTPIPTLGANYGQFTGRMACESFGCVFSAAVAGPATGNQAVLLNKFGVAEIVAVARKGAIVPLPRVAPDPIIYYSALLGESACGSSAFYRTTLSGTGVTTASNEALWCYSGGQNFYYLVLRKGQLINAAGQYVVKIVKAWSNGSDNAVALIQLGGPGVTAANDQALTWADYYTPTLLLREGDPAPYADGATIATINRVEVSASSGRYLALVTLAGAPAGTELALYAGYASHYSNDTALMRPSLYLRKGTLYENHAGKVKSINFPAASTNASGLGATGRGSALAENGRLAVTVEFENGVRQVMGGFAP